MSEIRYNRMEDSYVIIAPERLHRPDYMAWTKEAKDVTSCPFCEGHESKTPPEIFALRDAQSFANEKGWKTRVVPNLYKAVQIEAPHTERKNGTNVVRDGFGAHEIIIDHPEHKTAMSQWKHEDYVHWLQTLQIRVADLKKDSRIAHIALFKNHGPFAGATQPHAHTQLIGLPVVPQEIVKKYERLHHYYQESGRVLLDDMIEEERAQMSRLVVIEEPFVVFCPFASQFPFEVMIASSHYGGALDRLPLDALKTLSTTMQKLFFSMEQVLGDFDFNLNVAQTPVGEQHLHLSRFFIRIMPRIYRQGGFELSTGTMINPVEPERSALLLREALSGYVPSV